MVTQHSEEQWISVNDEVFNLKRDRITLEGGSVLVGTLPEGCKYCSNGSKLVLFVTGLCASSCYYCPLSTEKAGRDVIYADEMPVSDEKDIIFEARMIDAEGAGISGGDPLCQLDRTIGYINMLRREFGPSFHIHLYTSESKVEKNVLEQLIDAGLDELRFHPQSADWSGIELAAGMDISVGLEIPVIPGKLDTIIETAKRAEKIGVSFLNLNELEASETNFSSLSALGMRLTDMSSASIQGSRETAMDALEWARSNLERVSVHFCSSRYKDTVQMRKRLERRRENAIRPFEETDDDEPLLILGIIRAQHKMHLTDEDLETIYYTLATEFDVPDDLMNIDRQRSRIEIAPWIIDEIACDFRRMINPELRIEFGISFEYPSWDRLQTMFNPL
jgi:pyruvate formate-lyase activating enzyme-like uncharacterized protein